MRAGGKERETAAFDGRKSPGRPGITFFFFLRAVCPQVVCTLALFCSCNVCRPAMPSGNQRDSTPMRVGFVAAGNWYAGARGKTRPPTFAKARDKDAKHLCTVVHSNKGGQQKDGGRGGNCSSTDPRLAMAAHKTQQRSREPTLPHTQQPIQKENERESSVCVCRRFTFSILIISNRF